MPGRVPAQRGEDGEIRDILHSDHELALSRCELDEGILFRQRGAAEPAEDRDATRCRMQDSSCRRGLDWSREGSLQEIEDEGARGNQIVPYGPPVRRQDGEEGGRARRIEISERAVEGANRTERGPIA